MPPDRLPVVTTIHLIGLLVVNCAVLFKFVDEYRIYYNPHMVFLQGQVWRLVTSLLYHGHRYDFNLLVKLSLIVFSYKLEEGWYSNQNTADLAWLYILSISVLLITATLCSIPFLAMELHLIIVLVWSFRALGQLFRYKGVLIVSMAVLFMGYRAVTMSMWGCFFAMGGGCLYYFLEDAFPTWSVARGARILKTPELFTRMESWLRS